MSRKMKILIAYDGSSGADAALDDLSRAGLPPEVEVVVLSVAEPLPLPEYGLPPPDLTAGVVGGSTEAKPDRHAFKLDDVRKEADDAFLRG